MLGSPILDVAIGRMCVFLTLSLIVSAIQDLLSSLLPLYPEIFPVAFAAYVSETWMHSRSPTPLGVA